MPSWMDMFFQTPDPDEIERQIEIHLLEHLWEIPVDPIKDILTGPLQYRYDFFLHSARMQRFSPQERKLDLDTAKRLARAIMAEINDPHPAHLSQYIAEQELREPNDNRPPWEGWGTR